MYTRTRGLRERLESGRLLVLPGAANSLTARLIEDAGFEAAYVTGAGVSNTFLGAPDIGLLTLPELADHVAAIRGAVEIPLIVDADTGFGNAVNVGRTISMLERAGANAIQLEDQTFPKRCGHFAGKDVISAAEMESKVRAAVDARHDENLLIVARTDARAVLGLDEAIERANRYREAGADMVFVEAPRSKHEVEEVARNVPGPLVINIVEGGVTPPMTHERMEELGYAIALYANLPLLASIHAMQTVLKRLHMGETAFDGHVASWDERQRLVRKEHFDKLEEIYKEVQG